MNNMANSIYHFVKYEQTKEFVHIFLNKILTGRRGKRYNDAVFYEI